LLRDNIKPIKINATTTQTQVACHPPSSKYFSSSKSDFRLLSGFFWRRICSL